MTNPKWISPRLRISGATNCAVPTNEFVRRTDFSSPAGILVWKWARKQSEFLITMNSTFVSPTFSAVNDNTGTEIR